MKRRTMFLIIIIISGIIFTIAAFLIASNNKKCSIPVAAIQNEPITVNEFKLFMQDNRTVKGISVEAVREATLKQLARIKVEQIYAKQLGVIDDISYEGFLRSLKAENTRREKAFKNNEIIYGPVQYNERDYFAYVYSNMVINVKRKLETEGNFITENDVRTFYEINKAELYSNMEYNEYKDSIRVQAIHEKYEKMIDQRVIEAEILINKEIYNSITLE